MNLKKKIDESVALRCFNKIMKIRNLTTYYSSLKRNKIMMMKRCGETQVCCKIGHKTKYPHSPRIKNNNKNKITTSSCYA